MSIYTEKYIFNFLYRLFNPENRLEIIPLIKSDQLFFDRLIGIGSRHQILPSIYGGILRNKLSTYFPEDLLEYLKKIHQLNQNRNKLLFNQIEFLSSLFNENQINHVFLKGSAVIIDNKYDAMSERMIGDIDILIAENDLKKSEKLLKMNGFKENPETDFELTRDISEVKTLDRHLPRLVSPNFIAAVELHRNTLIKKFDYLLPSNYIFKNKRCVNNHWIPSEIIIWKHAIYNWQYNDHGINLNYLSFKTLVDVLYYEPNKIYKKLNNHHISVKHFYSLLSVFDVNLPVSHPLKKLIYSFYIKFKIISVLGKFYNKCVFFIQIFLSRIKLLFSSKLYRVRLLKNHKLIRKQIIDFWD